jgi:hypothetical protein
VWELHLEALHAAAHWRADAVHKLSPGQRGEMFIDLRPDDDLVRPGRVLQPQGLWLDLENVDQIR